MSELAKQFFENLRRGKEAILQIAPGLEHVRADLKAELNRLGTQGSMESASALFNGHGFVPYGPGQYTQSIEPEVPAPEQSLEARDIEGRGR